MSRRRSLWAMLSVVLLACLLFQAPVCAYAASTQKVSVTVTQNYKSAQTVLKLINARRKKAGLAAVKLDTKLTKSAIQRAAEVGIYTPHESPHRRPNGKLARTVNGKISYEICAEAEGGYVSDAEIVKSWMSSPSHKKGILLKSARSVGIACVCAGPGSYIWVCEFSNAKPAKVLKSTRQEATFNRTVVAKSSYVAKKYFKITTMDEQDGQSYQDIWLGYPLKLIPSFKGRYIYGITALNPKSFTWKSSDPSVATVSAAGVVTPCKNGKVTITATMKNRPAIKLVRTFEVFG